MTKAQQWHPQELSTREHFFAEESPSNRSCLLASFLPSLFVFSSFSFNAAAAAALEAAEQQQQQQHF